MESLGVDSDGEGGVVIIINAPKCPSPEPKQWWQKNAMYKVDVGEFNDFDGIRKELDYLVESGVGTVYITSFTKPTPSNDDGVLQRSPCQVYQPLGIQNCHTFGLVSLLGCSNLWLCEFRNGTRA